MNMSCCNNQTDHGPYLYVTCVPQDAMQNTNFRTAIWTGCHLQMTLMCIPMCSDIGLEIHEDTDQMIRIEEGMALVRMGCNRDCLDYQQNVCKGDVIFVPAGMWHNVMNTGQMPLKVSTIYAPPHHPVGTVHCTKADAEKKY